MQRPARLRVHNFRLLVSAMFDVEQPYLFGLLLQSLRQYPSDSVQGHPVHLSRLGRDHPWLIEEREESFIVRDTTGQALAYDANKKPRQSPGPSEGALTGARV